MGTIYGDGVSQGDVKGLYDNIHDNFNAVLTKLDSDGGVTDANYNSLHAVSAHGVSDIGRSWNDEYTFLDEFLTNFDAMLTKLDSDGGVGGGTGENNYNSTLALDTDLSSFNIEKDGVNQGNLVYLWDQILTQINALNAKLDADTNGPSDTDYASTYDITDNVDETGTDSN